MLLSATASRSAGSNWSSAVIRHRWRRRREGIDRLHLNAHVAGVPYTGAFRIAQKVMRWIYILPAVRDRRIVYCTAIVREPDRRGIGVVSRDCLIGRQIH